MVKINKVGHVVLSVSDFDAQVNFYRDALGMEVVQYQPERSAAFLSFGTQHHDIALFKARDEHTHGTIGLAHIAFQIEGGLEELKAVHQRLVDAGAEILSVTDHGMTNSVYFTDVDGNRLEVFCETMSPEEGVRYMRESGGTAKPLTLV